MKKNILVVLVLMLCSCVVKIDRNEPVNSFPIVNNKKSISLIRNPSYDLKWYKEHFEKSEMFSEVFTDGRENADYTLYISEQLEHPAHCTLTAVLSGLTYMIFPGICNTENSRTIELRLQDNHTQKIQSNYHIEGSFMFLGLLAIPGMLFTDNIFTMGKNTYDNAALRTYYMMESFE